MGRACRISGGAWRFNLLLPACSKRCRCRSTGQFTSRNWKLSRMRNGSVKACRPREQFHRAAYGNPSLEDRQYPWGNTAPAHRVGNFDFRRWDPEPVDATPRGDSAFGVSQMVGNGWEWTSTLFAPFPGFKARETYPGYSANFFDNRTLCHQGRLTSNGCAVAPALIPELVSPRLSVRIRHVPVRRELGQSNVCFR